MKCMCQMFAETCETNNYSLPGTQGCPRLFQPVLNWPLVIYIAGKIEFQNRGKWCKSSCISISYYLPVYIVIFNLQSKGPRTLNLTKVRQSQR